MSSLLLLLLSAVLVNVLVLSHLPEWRPFQGTTDAFDASLGVALATLIALPLTAGLSYALAVAVLQPLGLEYLRTLAFVLLILAITAAIDALFTRVPRWTPARPAFMTLLASNSAIFGVAWLADARSSGLFAAISLGVGAGLGFGFMLLAFAAIHQRLRHAGIPATLREAPIALITIGIMALAFMGFSGLIQE
jgi:electron transport complex protein RnfA